MNYIAEMNAFHDLLEQTEGLPTGQIALWYALMHRNNRCAWQEWFTVSNLTLSIHTGLSRQGIQAARNRLKQMGIIDFKANGTKATAYKLTKISLTMQDICQAGCRDSFQVGCQVDCQVSCQESGTLNKPKPKPKPKHIPPISPKGIFENFSNDNKTMLDALNDFEEMRKRIKKPMTDKAKLLLISSLEKLSKDKPNKTEYIIACLNQSVMNCWQGVFELKEPLEAEKTEVIVHEAPPEWAYDPNKSFLEQLGVDFK